jgi:hypothetical protein
MDNDIIPYLLILLVQNQNQVQNCVNLARAVKKLK